MNATAMATSTLTPRSSSERLPARRRAPATVTPVMMLIAGSAASSRHFSGTVRLPSSAPSGSSSATSAMTGCRISSVMKKRRNTPYIRTTAVPAMRIRNVVIPGESSSR